MATRVIDTVAEMRGIRDGLAGRVGLVPTMGALHAGHRELMRTARSACDAVVVSIFVNPTQFGPGDDYDAYPRDPERDRDVCQSEGVDVVFAPSVAEMYPPGETTRVDPGPIATILEGAHRPGHFVGVATIVSKLFLVTRPNVAVFGQKDAQQLAVIRRLARDLRFGVDIIGVPTVREPDGLAVSSRNAYLDEDERRAAPVLYRALCAAGELWRQGQRDAGALRRAMRDVLDAEPLAHTEYASVADPETFEELDRVDGPALASLAVRIGPARLIDNFPLLAAAESAEEGGDGWRGHGRGKGENG